MGKRRSAVRAKIRSELDNFHLDVDPRFSQYQPELTEIDFKKRNKERMRYLRKEHKKKIPHVGNKKRIKKRWEFKEIVMQ